MEQPDSIDNERALVLAALEIIRSHPPTMDFIDAVDFPATMDDRFHGAIPDLLLALKEPDEDVQLFAIKAIASIDGTIEEFVTDIAMASKAANQQVRRIAASLLGKSTGAAAAVAEVALRNAVRDPWAYLDVRFTAFRALVRLKRGILPALRFVIVG